MSLFYKIRLVGLILLSHFSLLAQQQLTVYIYDSESESPLAYANLYLKINQKGFTSDLDGKAVLFLNGFSSSFDSLQCSYVGYQDTIIAINLLSKKEWKVRLRPNSVKLSTVEIEEAAQNLDVKKIIKNTLKKVRKNYPQKAHLMSGFYRELVQEGDRYVQLNEAAVELNYAAYPQKNYARKGWNRYYETYDIADPYPTEDHTIFQNAQYFKYWNGPEDQCKIIAARSSEDWSTDNTEVIAINGPLGLTGSGWCDHSYFTRSG